jgi:hypothetical protein
MPKGKPIFTESELHKVIFYLTLGVPANLLGQIFKAAPATISDQIRKLRNGKLKGTPLPPTWTFRKQTHWFLSNSSNRTDPMFSPLYNALAPQYEELGLGASEVLVQVLSGDQEPDNPSRGYRILLRAVIGPSPMNASRMEVEQARKDALQEIVDGKLNVRSAAEADAIITARLFARLRDGYFSNFLSQQDVDIIDLIVGTLPEPERTVIRCRFGLQCKAQDLEQVCRLPQVAGDKRQVARIEAAGLRKLRNTERHKFLRSLTRPLPDRHSAVTSLFNCSLHDALSKKRK